MAPELTIEGNHAMGETQLGSEAATEIEAELSTLLHALRCLRRRRVVRLLNGSSEDDTVSTRWLARQIAGEENEVSPVLATSQQYKNAYNALVVSQSPLKFSRN